MVSSRRRKTDISQVTMHLLFKLLDFLYVLACDVGDSAYCYTKVLDGNLLWKLHAFGVWVACIQISAEGPFILLTDHSENIESTTKILHSRGWNEEKMLKIPQGPCSMFR